MSGYLSKAQVDKLLAPINTARVGRDGKGFSHVAAYEIRAMMSRVFGFGRWSEEVTEQVCLFETSEERESQAGKKYTAWTVCWRSLVRLTVCAPDGTVLAVYTEGSTGEASNQPSRADAHDLALKTSQSGAFKRAAANLGDAFGLSLYKKGSTDALVWRSLVYPFTETRPEPGGEAVDAHIQPDGPAAEPEQPRRYPRPQSESDAEEAKARGITVEQARAERLARNKEIRDIFNEDSRGRAKGEPKLAERVSTTRGEEDPWATPPLI